MPHIKEEQISAYLDRQVDAAESSAIDLHLQACESCRAVFGELRDLNTLFRDAEQVEPSPFLWNRIAASFETNLYKERSTRSWGASVIAGLRRYAWNPGFAAAAFAILMSAGIAVFRQNTMSTTDQAALAEIDRAYKSLAAQNPDENNPFSSGSPSDFDTNPFRSGRLGRSNNAR
jgi:anti-sigma factor RsiW